MRTMTRGRSGLGARHPKTGRRLLPLGTRKDGRLIWPILGGAEDDDDVGDDPAGGGKPKDKEKDKGADDDESDDDDETDESDDESDEDEPDADDEKLGEPGKKALQKERDKVKALRKENRALKKAKEGAPDEAETKAEARWKPVFVRREAAHALVAAGLIGKPDRLLKMLDVDKLDVDIDEDTGDVDIDGLEEQVSGLRKDYPSLFRKRGSGSIDASDRGGDRLNGGSKRDRTATQIQADALLGR